MIKFSNSKFRFHFRDSISDAYPSDICRSPGFDSIGTAFKMSFGGHDEDIRVNNRHGTAGVCVFLTLYHSSL